MNSSNYTNSEYSRRDLLKTLGYVVSATVLSDIFVACQADVKLSWKPVFLSNNQANTIAELSETILPKTKTPGAKDIGVPQFIDKMLKVTLSEKEQNDFLIDLSAFEKAFETEYKTPFVTATKAQKEAFCLKADQQAGKLGGTIWGIGLDKNPAPLAFFRRVKSLTLFGYFTSEQICKTVLTYAPVPGPYIGCVPLNEVVNSWSE